MLIDKKLHPAQAKLDFIVGIPVLFILGFIRDLVDLLWRPLKRFFWTFNKGQRTMRPRILVVKHSNVNEATLMLPALRLLKKQFKNAHITFLGGQGVGTFLMKTKLVDKAESFSLGTITQMMGASFMLVVDFETHMRFTGIVSCLMFKAPSAIGFETKGRGRHYGYDETHEFNASLQLGENYWNLAATACEDFGHSPVSNFEEDKTDTQKHLRTFLLEKSQAIVQMNLPESFTVLGPCIERRAHGWPAENWVNILKMVRQRHPGEQFLIVGKDEYANKEVVGLLEAEDASSWVDKLSLDEIFQIYSRASRVVVVDSFMPQLASLLNDNVILVGNEFPLWNGHAAKITDTCVPCLTWGADYGCLDPNCSQAKRVEQKVKAV